VIGLKDQPTVLFEDRRTSASRLGGHLDVLDESLTTSSGVGRLLKAACGANTVATETLGQYKHGLTPSPAPPRHIGPVRLSRQQRFLKRNPPSSRHQ
jgi:hypothetical protein